MEFNNLEIVLIPVDQITPYEGNARKHTPKDVEQIRASIEADGFNDPLAVWGERNVIVEGHGRLMAAKALGLKVLPCIRLDHLTDEQRREYAIRHNRSAEFSTWDFELLAEEIARLEAEGMDLSSLEFRLDREEETPMVLGGSGAVEYGEEDFGDDRFECECPVCGFRFNEK